VGKRERRKKKKTSSSSSSKREREREREMVPTPDLLILGGMSSGPGGMASTRGGFYFFSFAVRFRKD
jgi:hypothetical protein